MSYIRIPRESEEYLGYGLYVPRGNMGFLSILPAYSSYHCFVGADLPHLPPRPLPSYTLSQFPPASREPKTEY